MDEALIARVFQLFLALAGAYLLALWFALVVWTYRDITSRSTNPFTQIFSTLVVVLFFVPGAIIYLILRPRETLDEAFQRAMEEEYLLQDLDDFPACRTCRRTVRDDFVFCPYCRTELRRACTTCHRLVDVRWEVCAYCGAGQAAHSELRLEEPERESAVGRGRTRVVPASLQAIDGGRAPRRAEQDDDEPGPRPLRDDDDGGASTVELAEVTGGDGQLSDDDAGSVSATMGAPVRNRSGRGRATGQRRGGSGS